MRLKNGKELRGRVLVEGADRVLLSKGGKEQWIPLAQVRGVDSVLRRLEKYLEDEGRISAEDLAARVALAKEIQAAGLAREAALEAWTVLRRDPQNAEAHALLGHRKKGSRWLLPVGQDWLGWTEALRIRSDWGKAWEFETEHFALRTDHAIFSAVQIARDLERFYVKAIRLLAPAEARENVEPVHVHLHRDAKDFPQRGLLIEGYFLRNENRVFALLEESGRPHVLLHEVAHAIFHNAILRGESGAPAWLDEGLAEYLSGCVPEGPGPLRFEEGSRKLIHFDRVRNQKELFSFKGMLNFAENDFASSDRRDLRYSQAYTFVHFLLHGDGMRNRDGLFAFLRDLPRGSASPTRFFEILGVPAETVERRWLAYVGR